MKKKRLIGILAIALLGMGCLAKPHVAAQRTILNAVDALRIADGAIVAAYPSVEGTDDERMMWLTRAVCALRVSRDILQVGWDVTFYWADDGKVCTRDGEVVPSGTEGAVCIDGERSWQEWVRVSVPVVLHAMQVLRDFGVEIPDAIAAILEGLASAGEPDEAAFDADFDACVSALRE